MREPERRRRRPVLMAAAALAGALAPAPIRAQPQPYLLADLNRRDPQSSNPTELAALGDRLYFQACDAPTGCELWQSDGVATVRVADLAPGSVSSSPMHLVALGDQLLFTATDPTAGRELWATDGTTTVRLADIAPGAADGVPGPLVRMGDRIYFHVLHPGRTHGGARGAGFRVHPTASIRLSSPSACAAFMLRGTG